jgi:DNA repair protein RadD
MRLRPYQQEALDALDAFWDAGGGHPLVSMATATGKSLVIAKLILDIVAGFPELRALILVHVRELVGQNFKHLTQIWPDAPLGAIGINCASLRRRDWDAPIIFATIPSVWKHAQKLGPRHLIIGDECHLWPRSGDGRYRTLLAGQRRVAGFTATPFRLDSGYLCEGDDKIFDQVVFEYGIAQGIKDNYLAPLSSKATDATIDVTGVAVRAGDDLLPHCFDRARLLAHRHEYVNSLPAVLRL